MKNSKSNKAKHAAILASLMIMPYALSGCGNRSIIDLKYTFNKAIIFNSDKSVACIVDIDMWTDYDGEQIQIQLEDGSFILTSSFDTKLIYVNEDTIQAEDIARSLGGEDVEITYLNNSLKLKKD